MSAIPEEAVDAFFRMILASSGQSDPRQPVLEHFKERFSGAAGVPSSWSSSTSWAETDLKELMGRASQNAPLFIEAFHVACITIRRVDRSFVGPDEDMINTLLREYDIGYELRPPQLILRDSGSLGVAPVSSPAPPPTIDQQAAIQLQESLQRSEQLLAEGHGREAVQELLWVLESATTAFRGLDTGTSTVEGKYFNQIVRDLRGKNPGTTLNTVLAWVAALHGYLSSPTGGGVRHGLDLRDGVSINEVEARLYCNLIRSYLGFLFAEQMRMASSMQVQRMNCR